jgi:hypothetical protein
MREQVLLCDVRPREVELMVVDEVPPQEGLSGLGANDLPRRVVVGDEPVVDVVERLPRIPVADQILMEVRLRERVPCAQSERFGRDQIAQHTGRLARALSNLIQRIVGALGGQLLQER